MPRPPRSSSIALRRLWNQWLSTTAAHDPSDVVARLGAVQAQEYEPAKWGVGQRMGSRARNEDVERAFGSGEILRTHVLRPTWHFVARDDIRWMLALTAPRVHLTLNSYCRRQGIDRRTLTRSTAIFERSLRDGQQLTRSELRERLHGAGIVAAGIRLAFLTIYAELEAVICSGARRDRQFTYALVAERAPRAGVLPRDQALAELSRRYFSSHGPATVRDFSWWSGLTIADAKRGVEMISASREEVDGLTYWTADGNGGRARTPLVHLLPIYDEYFVAYRDRMAVPHVAVGKRPGTF